MSCCWEKNILIEGPKMSSIEGLDFSCCQQTRVISTEVSSIHKTLNTMAADDRNTEVNFEVAIKWNAFKWNVSMQHFNLHYRQVGITINIKYMHQNNWVKSSYSKAAGLSTFSSFILEAAVQDQDKSNQPPAIKLQPLSWEAPFALVVLCLGSLFDEPCHIFSVTRSFQWIFNFVLM